MSADSWKFITARIASLVCLQEQLRVQDKTMFGRDGQVPPVAIACTTCNARFKIAAAVTRVLCSYRVEELTGESKVSVKRKLWYTLATPHGASRYWPGRTKRTCCRWRTDCGSRGSELCCSPLPACFEGAYSVGIAHRNRGFTTFCAKAWRAKALQALDLSIQAQITSRDFALDRPTYRRSFCLSSTLKISIWSGADLKRLVALLAERLS